MARVHEELPTLVGGVSQQPDAIRFKSQAERIENAWLSPAEGVVPRAGTEHIRNAFTDKGGPVFTHVIDRSADERYIVTIRNNELKVFDLDGVEYPVHMPSSNQLRDPMRIKSSGFWTFTGVTDIDVGTALGPDGLDQIAGGVSRLDDTGAGGGTATQTVPNSDLFLEDGEDYIGWCWMKPNGSSPSDESVFQVSSSGGTGSLVIDWTNPDDPTVTPALTLPTSSNGITRWGIEPRLDGWFIVWVALTYSTGGGVAFTITPQNTGAGGSSLDVWRPGLMRYDRNVDAGLRDELWENRPSALTVDGQSFGIFDVPYIDPEAALTNVTNRVAEDYFDLTATNLLELPQKVGDTTGGFWSLRGAAAAVSTSAIQAPFGGNHDIPLGDGQEFYNELVCNPASGGALYDQTATTFYDGPQLVGCYFTKRDSDAECVSIGIGNTVNSAFIRVAYRWSGTDLVFDGTVTSPADDDSGLVDYGAIQSPYDPEDWFVWAVFDPNRTSKWTTATARQVTIGIETGDAILTLETYAWGAMLQEGVSAPQLGFDSFLAPTADLQATTVNDFTFIANPNVAVQRGFERDQPDITATRAYIFVQLGGFVEDYRITVRRSGAADIAVRLNTWDGAAQAGYCVGADPGLPASMANCNANGGTWVALDEAISETNDIAESLARRLTAAGLTATAIGSVIEIVTTTGNAFDSFELSDSQGDQAMRLIWREVENISELPLNMRDGWRVKVVGDRASAADDYWVQFEAERRNEFGTGLWVESIPWGQHLRIDRQTFIRQLVRRTDNADGDVTGTAGAIYFELGRVALEDRKVGDDDSNPFPEFVSLNGVTRSISEVFTYQSRLGVLSSELLAMSETNRLFNFFRTTILGGLLDSDPVLTKASTTDVANLNHAVIQDERLYVTSDRQQFIVSGNPITPTTVRIEPKTSFESFRRIGPLVSGRGFFVPFPTEGLANDSVNFSGMRELVPTANASGTTEIQAETVTDAVPAYIPGEVQQMAVSTLHQALFVRASNRLFVYKYAESGGQAVQQAWSEWTFSGPVLGMGIVRGELILLTNFKDGSGASATNYTRLERIRLGDFLKESGKDWLIRLDRRMVPQDASYDSGLDETTYTFSDPLSTSLTLKAVKQSTGADVPIRSSTSTTLTVAGDQREEPLWVGEEFQMQYEFSKPRLSRQGQPVTGRDTVLQLNLRVDDSAAVQVSVAQRYAQTFTSDWTAEQVGLGSGVLGQINLVDSDIEVALGATPEELTITVKSVSYLPLRLVSASFEHSYSPRTGRFG